MARDNFVRLSDEEMQIVKQVKSDKFNTDSVPIGEVIGSACEEVINE